MKLNHQNTYIYLSIILAMTISFFQVHFYKHFFVQLETTTIFLMHPVILVEVRMAMLVVHHDKFLTPYINNKFKGSHAAENFSCGCTKTVAIVWQSF